MYPLSLFSGRATNRQQHISSTTGDEDSNSGWVSSSGKKRSRHHQGGSAHGPLSPNKPSLQASLEGTSDSDEDNNSAKEKEKRRKVSCNGLLTSASPVL